MEKMRLEINLIYGSILAAICSYYTWESLAWAIVNGFCSWFYVIYWLIRWGDW